VIFSRDRNIPSVVAPRGVSVLEIMCCIVRRGKGGAHSPESSGLAIAVG
jgi:hypothetical protein